MTLGTDIKFTHSLLSAKWLCWWKLIWSYFKAQNLWSEDNLNTNGRGLSSDVDSPVLSVSRTSVTSTFQGEPLLSNTCFLFTIYAPSKPRPFAKIKIDASAHARIFTARNYTFGNLDFEESRQNMCTFSEQPSHSPTLHSPISTTTTTIRFLPVLR